MVPQQAPSPLIIPPVLFCWSEIPAKKKHKLETVDELTVASVLDIGRSKVLSIAVCGTMSPERPVVKDVSYLPLYLGCISERLSGSTTISLGSELCCGRMAGPLEASWPFTLTCDMVECGKKWDDGRKPAGAPRHVPDGRCSAVFHAGFTCFHAQNSLKSIFLFCNLLQVCRSPLVGELSFFLLFLSLPPSLGFSQTTRRVARADSSSCVFLMLSARASTTLSVASFEQLAAICKWKAKKERENQLVCLFFRHCKDAVTHMPNSVAQIARPDHGIGVSTDPQFNSKFKSTYLGRRPTATPPAGDRQSRARWFTPLHL
jgi:hypothetical protein